MRKDGRWTPDEIADRFDELGQEPMPILERLAASVPRPRRAANEQAEDQ